jgi:hypothetical protein
MSAMVSGRTMSNWRQSANHGDKPSRSEAFRRLVELGLKVKMDLELLGPRR